MHLLLQSVINGLIIGSIYAIGAVTFGIIYDLTKVFHLAFGAIGMLGAYVAVSVAGTSGGVTTMIEACLLGVLATAATTIVTVTFVYDPLVRRGADSGITFVASLSLELLLSGGILLIFGPTVRTFSVAGFLVQHDIGGYEFSSFYLFVVVVLLVIAVSLSWVLTHTRTGNQIRAIASNREQAQLVGIQTRLLIAGACAVAGGLSAVAFILQGMQGNISDADGTELTLFAVLAVLAGGIGSIGGPIIVGLAIGVVGSVTVTVLPGQWSTTVIFLAATLLILTRPRGLIQSSTGASR